MGIDSHGRSVLPELKDWDAVWFASRSLPSYPHTGDMPSTADRTSRQKYIFWEIESPAYLQTFKPLNYLNFFNWTISYREDSTVRLPYGGVKLERSHPQGKELDRLVSDFGKENTHLAARRSSEDEAGATVAWMVSNCLTESNREGFVEDLRNHIKIDIYGTCYQDSLRCDKGKAEDCWNDIADKYKFYLSFENSICKDYVTEKFWEPLKRNIVPVVLGGGDYGSIAPYHSHIDVMKEGFAEDTKGLADLLIRLSKNHSEYASYFWWKSYYSVINNTDKERAGAPCEVCRKLHEDQDQSQIGLDIQDWWVNQASCSSLLSYDREILRDLDDEEDFDDYDIEDEPDNFK